ncbi:MAG: DUF1376 domain-containing protein, partial [Chloroflexi bacterium]|nr:DUF1376 domain-containing protein [Chloroflexota bacterium]
MAEFPAMPLWTDAYIADTQHLTNEEHGVYLRLLMFAWRPPEGCLPDDGLRLAIMVGVTSRVWARLKPTVMAFWTLTDGKWSQKRLTAERDFAIEKRERNRAAGKASAAARSLKNNNSRSTSVATDVSTKRQREQQRNANPHTHTHRESSSGEEDSSPTGRVTPLSGAGRPGTRSARSAPVWEAYAPALLLRYGPEPPRNAKTNALLCQLVDRLGAEDAPHVAEFYLRHSARWYVEKGHSVAALVVDAEKLRTEWATG